MATFNRSTLVKVLEVLDSSHAGEALAAARLAATMVREAGLSWDEILMTDIAERVEQQAPQSPGSVPPATGRASGTGPFGYRRDRELSLHEQFFMILLSPRTPPEIKRKLQGWEARVLDGEITPQDTQDLHSLYQSFVAG